MFNHVYTRFLRRSLAGACLIVGLVCLVEGFKLGNGLIPLGVLCLVVGAVGASRP